MFIMNGTTALHAFHNGNPCLYLTIGLAQQPMVNFHEIEHINLWLIDFQKFLKHIIFI